MKKTLKSILIKDLKPTVDLIVLMRKELGKEKAFITEVTKLTDAGILHRGNESDIPKLTEERLNQLRKEGKSIFQDSKDRIKESIQDVGYVPEKYSHMRVFRDNYVVDGCKRLSILKELFNDDYEVTVEELTL